MLFASFFESTLPYVKFGGLFEYSFNFLLLVILCVCVLLQNELTYAVFPSRRIQMHLPNG